MKYPIMVDFEKPLSKRVLFSLGRKEIVLLDSSALFSLVEDPGWDPPLGLGKRVCAVCDFILREAANAERWQRGTSKVRRTLTLLAEDPGRLLVEIRTPVRFKSAHQRDSFADFLPRVLRRRVIRGSLSGTDKSLLAVAWYLQQEGLKVLVATRDQELMEACRELGIEARLPDEVEEVWPGEKVLSEAGGPKGEAVADGTPAGEAQGGPSGDPPQAPRPGGPGP